MLMQLLSLDAVAQSLGLSKHTIRSFVRQGRLRPTKVCRRLLFDPADVESFVRRAQGEIQTGSDHSTNDFGPNVTF